jgi:DNA-binding NtrC family response regulator
MAGKDCKPLQGMRILIVDDDPQIRKFFVEEIEYHGGMTVTAANGEEGVQVYQNDPSFDLILSDMRMPHGDGLFLFRKLKEVSARPFSFILITGFADISESEARKEGILRIFEKPVDWDALIDFMAKFNSQLFSP